MKRSPILNSFIEALLESLPAFQYHEDHEDEAYAKVANQVMESAIMAIMIKSNDCKVDIDLAWSAYSMFQETFVDHCHISAVQPDRRLR